MALLEYLKSLTSKFDNFGVTFVTVSKLRFTLIKVKMVSINYYCTFNYCFQMVKPIYATLSADPYN